MGYGGDFVLVVSICYLGSLKGPLVLLIENEITMLTLAMLGGPSTLATVDSPSSFSFSDDDDESGGDLTSTSTGREFRGGLGAGNTAPNMAPPPSPPTPRLLLLMPIRDWEEEEEEDEE